MTSEDARGLSAAHVPATVEMEQLESPCGPS